MTRFNRLRTAVCAATVAVLSSVGFATPSFAQDGPGIEAIEEFREGRGRPDAVQNRARGPTPGSRSTRPGARTSPGSR